MDFQTAILLLVFLQVKHFLADFCLQTPRMLSGRDIYLHWGRAEHAGLHAILSFLALMLVGGSLVAALVLSVAEFFVHYNIDWAKGRHAATRKHSPSDPEYWRAFGFDQLMHQLTYVVIVWMSAIYAV
jgi:hypothetical protein